MKSKLSKMKPCKTVVFSRLFVHEYVLTFLYPTLEIFPKNGSKIPVKRFIICGQSICTDWKIHQISTSLTKKANSRDSRTVCFENARLAILHFVRGINRARSFKRVQHWPSYPLLSICFPSQDQDRRFLLNLSGFLLSWCLSQNQHVCVRSESNVWNSIKICRQSCE